MKNSSATPNPTLINAENKIWTWLDKVVIGENFCPFAKVPRQQNRIKIVVSNAVTIEQVLAALAQQCVHLDEHKQTETTLLAFTQILSHFDDYLDVLDMANQLLDDLNYEGVYQLASFHPEYLFAGEPSQAISHYTNRAPYPIFHLIREDSLSQALHFVDNPEQIPVRNVKHANQLGLAFFKQFL